MAGSSSAVVPSSSSVPVAVSCELSGVTVQIGEQVWMKKNLNCNVSGSKCGDADGKLKNENTSYCDTYGRLYNWATAMGLPFKCNAILSTSDTDCAIKSPHHQGICPVGWHIPSNAEWGALVSFVGTSAGTKLKADSELWNENGRGTDEFGFSALPGGYGSSDGNFGLVGDYSYWWTASENGGNHAFGRDVNFNFGGTATDIYSGKLYLHSVRCLKD